MEVAVGVVGVYASGAGFITNHGGKFFFIYFFWFIYFFLPKYKICDMQCFPS